MAMQRAAVIGAGVCLLALAACSPPVDQSSDNEDITLEAPVAQVTGSVTYKERIALPAGAEMNIRLLDISKADVAADVLAETNIVDPKIPVTYALPYDPALIRAGMSYSVRAEIRHADKLLFTTDTAHSVLTRGAGNTADIVLLKITTPTANAAAVDRRLFSARWQLQSINGIAPADIDEERPPFVQFTANGRINGFAGCNNFQGGWEYVDSKLQFGPLAATVMACGEGMDTEQAFLQALASAERYSIERGDLSLYNGNNVVLLFRGSD